MGIAQKRKLGSSNGAKSIPQGLSRKRFKKQTHYDSDDSSSSSSSTSPSASAPTVPAKATIRTSKTTASARDAHFSSASSASSDPGSESATGDSTSDGASGFEDESDEAGSSDSNLDPSETSSAAPRKKAKKNDPSAFASSISAILGSSLTRAKRDDPVLSRSKTAAEASKEIADTKLTEKARRRLRDESRLKKEKGRVKDVLLGEKKHIVVPAVGTLEGAVEGEGKAKEVAHTVVESGPSAAEIAAQERRLRKTAQRGVVKLFNAVRAAQVKGEEEARSMREKGVVGMDKRGEGIERMGRGAFLELVGAGGKEKGK